MKTATLSAFRRVMKKYLDCVSDESEHLVIHRPKGKGVVILSAKEYGSWMATIHEFASQRNHERLMESIQQVKKGKTQEVEFNPVENSFQPKRVG